MQENVKLKGMKTNRNIM